MSASRKRLRIQEDSQTAPTESSSSNGAKKRMVQRKTVEKWMKELDKKHSTCLWLKFEVADKRSLVTAEMLQFSEKLQSLRNFRSAFIGGSSNIRVSSVKEHAGTDIYSSAMHLLKKQHSLSVFEYMHLLLDVWVILQWMNLLEKTSPSFSGSNSLSVTGPQYRSSAIPSRTLLWSYINATLLTQKELKL